MTEKLYYIDSYIKDFTAHVTACRRDGPLWRVALDRTAFFPEGGGQGADPGEINGVPVSDVRELDGEIEHFLPSPLPVGCEVRGILDWPERLRRMQNHSGEHLVSGTVHRLFCYSNVGFHMDGCGCTLDFDGELSPADLERVERLANEAIWEDLPVSAVFPTQRQLETMEYRSKKELSGQVRIVEMQGVDVCACCAPHVKATGAVGCIKTVEAARHRGGMRLSIVCGSDALRDYSARLENNARVSHALSAKPFETGEAVEKYMAEAQETHRRAAALALELAAVKAAAIDAADSDICVFEPSLDMNALRELVNALMEKRRLCAAFTGSDGDYKYVIGCRTQDLGRRAGEINRAIDGQGGGRGSMIQGTSRAGRGAIEAYFLK